MRLTVAKNLNARIGSPSISASTNSYLTSGQQVEIKAVLYGDIIDGNGIWYQSDLGLYYWSGGIYETVFSLGISLDQFHDEEQMAILLLLKNQAIEVLSQQVHGYLGCGIGFKNLDDNNPLSLIVYVDPKNIANSLGKSEVLKEIRFKGILIPTDVVKITNSKHQYTDSPNKRNLEQDTPPLIGGGIQSKDTKVQGTRSIVVKRPKEGVINSFEYFLLASFHVLLNDQIKAKYTDCIYNGDGSRKAGFPLNQYYYLEKPIVEGCYTGDFDYAAVKLDSANDVLNKIEDHWITEFYDLDQLHTLQGKQVYAIGFISGKQESTVKGLFTSITLKPHFQTFENVIITGKLSVNGDSGAPVFESTSHKLIGFILGGDDENISYIIPFYNLKYQKKFNLNTI